MDRILNSRRLPSVREMLKGGAAIELEVWELEPAAFGDTVSEIPRPLGIGNSTHILGELVILSNLSKIRSISR